MRRVHAFCVVTVLFLSLLTGCGFHNSTHTIEVSAGSDSLTVGSSLQLKAVAVDAIGNVTDITSRVSWSSSNGQVATISGAGILNAVSAGSVTVSAQLSKNSGTMAIAVINPGVVGLTLSPANAMVAGGATQQYTAIGNLSNKTTADLSSSVAWSVKPAGVASIDSHGLLTAGMDGSYLVTATDGANVSSVPGTVSTASIQPSFASITVTPTSGRLANGSKLQLRATGIYANGVRQDVTSTVQWSSANTSVVTVSSAGVASGVGVGEVVVQAALGSSMNQATLIITPAQLTSVVLYPGMPSIAKGTTEQLHLTGIYSDDSQQDLTAQANWVSSNPTIMSVNATGTISGLQTGSAQVTASVGGFSATTSSVTVTAATLTSIAVTPAIPQLALGTSEQLTLTGTFSDGTTQDLTNEATWTSLTSAAQISSQGLASAISTGTAQFSVSVSGLTIKTPVFQVTSAVLKSLSINPVSGSMALGTSEQFTAMGTFSDGTTQDLTSDLAVWQSSNPPVATINGNGLAESGSIGGVVLSASFEGITAQTTSFQVTPAALVSVALTPPTASIAKGTTQQFTLNGSFSDGTTQDLTAQAMWVSSNSNVVVVSAQGLARAVGVGTAQVSASFGGKEAQTRSFTVTPATVVSVAITPTAAVIPGGSRLQFTATAVFSDGSTQDITSQVAWTSSNPSAISITASGLATGVGPGSAVISASFDGQTYVTGSIQGSSATVSSITISPANATVFAGTEQQFTASATLSDGTTVDMTSQVTWSSSNVSFLSIDANGLATAYSTASNAVVTVSSVSGSVSATDFVTVTPASRTVATLTSLAVVPTSARIAAGTQEQLIARGVFSDGSTRELSASATWTSTSPSIATVRASGLATGVSVGSSIIQATVGALQAQSTLLTTSATLVSLAITPVDANFANGSSQQFRLIGTFTDNSTQDLSNQATWRSSNTAVATINNTGVAMSVDPGAVQFSANYGGQTATTSTVNVTSAQLVSIAIDPNTASIAEGTMRQFRVIGSYSDGTTQDLTSQASWQSTNGSVVTIDGEGVATALATGTAEIMAGFDGQTATTQFIQSTPATLVSMAVTPQNASFADGTTTAFSVIGTFSDGTTQDLTDQAIWASSTPQVLTIDGEGVAEGGSQGVAQVSASLDGIIASTNQVQVTPAVLVSLSISPSTASFAQGTTQKFSATGHFSDGSTQDLSTSVQWSASNASAVSIDGSGLATAQSPGTAQISATYLGQTATTGIVQATPAILVSVAVSPDTATIAAGTTKQFRAVGTYSDGSTQTLSSGVTWTSTNPSVASVVASGLVTGNSTGQAQISFTYQGQTATTSAFQVTAATLQSISLSPLNASISRGSSQAFQATGHFSDGSSQDLTSSATWTSSQPAVASISASGVALGASPGTTSITAQSGTVSVNTDLTVNSATLLSISVTPSGTSVVVGTTTQFQAIATYSDGSTQNITSQVTWSSSNPSAASINSIGLLTVQTTGAITISATNGATITSVNETAVSATLVSMSLTPSAPSIAKGTTQQFQVTGTYNNGETENITDSVSWQSSAPNVATVSNTGLASGVSSGNAQIWVNEGSVDAMVTLTVSPATLVSLATTPQSASIANGTSQQFHAMGTLSDGSTQDLTNTVSWSSSNSGAATMNASGLATSSGVGTTTIAAQSGTVTTSSTLNVTSATAVSVSVTPNAPSLAAGQTLQLLATATFTDGTSQDVTASATYLSSDSGAVKISSAGLLTAMSSGSAIVTVIVGNTSTTIPITITNSVLSSITISPSQVSVAAGIAQQLTATGCFSDGSTSDLSSIVAWSSSNAHIASVDIHGKLTAAATGSVTITAVDGSVNSSVPATVTAATIQTIAITPASSTLAAGQSQQFAAVAEFSDGSQQTVTDSVHWSVGASALASVSNAAGSQGLVTAKAAGNTTVSAAIGTVQGSATLTVQPATLTSLSISPQPVSLAAGTTAQLTAIGVFSDGSNADLTASVQWTSASASTAVVSNSGLLTGTGVGATSIIASSNSVSASLPVTVTNAVLTSITISPNSATLALGVQKQFVATGVYSDGGTANITSQVRWTSSATNVAVVSNRGLVDTLAEGSSTIAASLNGVAQQATVNVGAAVLQSITVSGGGSLSVALGLSLQLSATGVYTDGSTQNVTELVTWSSSNANVGLVNFSGLVASLGQGTFTASASLNGVTGIAQVTVTSAVLQSITISPANAVILDVLGSQVAYTATGHYSDGSVHQLTNAHWAITSGLALGSISQSGIFSPVGVGAGTLSASYKGVSASTGFTVVAAF